MATIKYFFDARHVSVKTNEAPLKIAVGHLSKTAYISTPIKLEPSCWDFKHDRVGKHPRKKYISDEIMKLCCHYMELLEEVEKKYDINTMNAKQLRDRIVEFDNPDRIKFDEPNSVVNVFERFIDLKAGHTKELYKCTLRKLKGFLSNRADDIRFEEINVEMLHRLDAYLARTAPSANARAIHMRNLRAVFNYAIDCDITNNYPFRRFKIKHEETRKRNFDVETLRAIFNAEVEPWQEKYRDLFKLMFMLMGINFVDLCNLKEIQGNRVQYVRAKTKKIYDIKIEPEAAELIEKYRGNITLLNYMDSYKNYRHFYNNACKGLRAIKDKLNDEGLNIETLTTYWARHSWATIAAYLDIPKETIAQALGHSGHSVTDIYIAFDRRKVDVANRRVLNYVLYGYEDGYAPGDPVILKRIG